MKEGRGLDSSLFLSDGCSDVVMVIQRRQIVDFCSLWLQFLGTAGEESLPFCAHEFLQTSPPDLRQCLATTLQATFVIFSATPSTLLGP